MINNNWILLKKQDNFFYNPFAIWINWNELSFEIGIRLFFYECSYSKYI